MKNSEPAVHENDGQNEIKTKKPRSRFRLTAILMSILSLLLLAALLLVIFLPSAIEREVNKILAGFADNGAMNIQVKRIGLWQSEFSFDVIRHYGGESENSESVMKVGACVIRYRPAELFHQHIRSIDLSDANIVVDIGEDRPFIPLLNVIRMSGAKAENKKEDDAKDEIFLDLDSMIPVTVGEINISGNLVLRDNFEAVNLPYAINLKPVDTSFWNKLKVEASLSQSMNNLSYGGVLNLNEGTLVGELKGRLDTDYMPFLVRGFLPRGTFVEMEFSSFFAYDIDCNQLLYIHISSVVAPFADLPDYQMNCVMACILNNGSMLDLTLYGLSAKYKGVDYYLDSVTCEFDKSMKDFSGSLQFRISDSPRFTMDYKLHRDDENAFQLESELLPFYMMEQSRPYIAYEHPLSDQDIDNLSDDYCSPEEINLFELMDELNRIRLTSELDNSIKKIHLGGMELSFLQPAVTLNAAYSAANGLNFNLKGSLTKPGMNHAKADVSSEALSFEASGTPKEFTYTGRMENLRADAFDVTCGIPGITLNGEFKENSFDSDIVFSDGRVTASKFKIAADGVSGEFPFVFPSVKQDSEKGMLRVPNLYFDSKNIGSGAIAIAFEDNKLALGGTAELLGVNAGFTSETELFSAGGVIVKNTFKLPKQPIPEKFDVSKFLPAFDDLAVDGNLQLSAKYDITPLGSKGDMSLKLSEVNASSEKNGLSVHDLRLSFNMPALPALASRANQTLAFKALKYNNFLVDSATIRFRMEEPTIWYLESAQMDWCGGKIRVGSTRLAPESRFTPITLHCDRIDLVKLLNQCGVGQGEGHGEISGTIPVVFRENKIIFRDGFLYSTPGEEGKIRLILNQKVASDIAAQAGMKGTLDMTQEAMKDFVYSWAKVQLNTEYDLLKLKLQLNGKPVEALHYKPGAGGFTETDIPHLYQGILLDLNIYLPLNEMFQIMNSINKLQK